MIRSRTRTALAALAALLPVAALAADPVAPTFATPAGTSAVANPVGVEAADFDRDGDLDWAVADFVTKECAIRRNNGGGLPTSTDLFFLSTAPDDVAKGDFDGDGWTDLVFATGDGVIVARNMGLDGFQRLQFMEQNALAKAPGVTLYQRVAAADYDGDGDLDLFAAGPHTPESGDGMGVLSVWLNGGGGAFGAPTSHVFETSWPDSLAAGDLTGDGKAEILVGARNTGLQHLFANYGEATVELGIGNQSTTTTLLDISTILIGDVTRDGRADVVWAGSNPDVYSGNNITVYVLPGLADASGTQIWNRAFGYELDAGPTSGFGVDNDAAIADLNGDGFNEVVATHRDGGKIAYFLLDEPIRDGSGNVSGLPPVTYRSLSAGTSPKYLAAGDLTGDGKVDLVVVNGGSNGGQQAHLFVNNTGSGGGGGDSDAARKLTMKSKKFPDHRYQDGQKFTFSCEQAPTEGMTIRLQSTTTPADPESWQDLPLQAYFLPPKKKGATKWTLTTTLVPVGEQYFRTVTNTPELGDVANTDEPGSGPYAYVGPYTILSAGPVLVTKAHVYPASDVETRTTTHAGDTITIVIAIRNQGTEVAENIEVDFKEPMDTTLVQASPTSPGWTALTKLSDPKVRDHKFRWIHPSLGVGQVTYYIAQVRVDDDPRGYIKIREGDIDADPEKGREFFDGEDVVLDVVSPVKITVVARQDDPAPGELLSWDLVCTNGGSETLRSAVAWDRLPRGVGFDSAYFVDANGDPVVSPAAAPLGRPNPWFDEANRRVYWYLGDVPAQGVHRLRLVSRVCYDQQPGSVVVNGAFEFLGAGGGRAGNAADLGTLDVSSGEARDVETTLGSPAPSAVPALRLGQDAYTSAGTTVYDRRYGDVRLGTIGDEILYVFTMKNTGGAAAERVRLNGNLPHATTLVAGSVFSGTNIFDAVPATYTLSNAAQGTGTIDVALGTLAAGQRAFVAFRVTVDAGVPDRTGIGNTGFNVFTSSVAGHVFASPTVLNVLVTKPYVPYVETRAEVDGSGPTKGRVAEGGTLTFATTYENRGGQAGASVVLDQTVPEGCSYLGVDFFDGSDAPTSPGYAVKVTKKKISVTLGTLAPGAKGKARFRFTVAKAPKGGVVKSEAKLGGALGGTAKAGTKVSPSSWTGVAQVESDDTPKLFLARIAPQVVETGLEFTYVIVFGNASEHPVNDLVMTMEAPSGTRILDDESLHYPGVDFRGNKVTWRIAQLDPHAAGVRKVSVYVDPNADQRGNAIIEKSLRIQAGNAVGWHLQPQASLLLKTGTRFESYAWPAFGVAAEAVGAVLGSAEPVGIEDAIRAITQSSTSVVACGNDMMTFTNGSFFTPMGNGTVVAHGKAADVYFRNGAEASSAVYDTWGTHRFIHTTHPQDLLISGVQSGDPADVSAMLQAPTSFVQAGVANMIAGGSFTLIARDGRTYFDVNGNGLGTLTELRTGNLVAAGAGNLVAAGAGNIVAAGAGNLVAAGGGNLVAAGAGNIVAAGGGNLVAAGAGNMVAAGAGNLVAAGAGNMVAAGAGNLVAAGAGN